MHPLTSYATVVKPTDHETGKYQAVLRLYQGWPTSQGPRATFLTVLPQRAAWYTCTSPHFFFTHTHTFPQLDLLQISHTNMTMT